MPGSTRAWRTSARDFGAKIAVPTLYLARPAKERQYYNSLKVRRVWRGASLLLGILLYYRYARENDRHGRQV
jgi:hypothetical protein